MTIASPDTNRARIVAAIRESERALVDLAGLAEVAPRDVAARLELHEAAHHDMWAAAADAYLKQLPRRAISRCPITGVALELAIDDAGLDGPWWRYDAPLRPAATFPPTFVGLTGAMQLHAPIERAPYLAAPGPGVSWLLPRLLEGTSVVAVISMVPVGAHAGIAVAYFAATDPGLDPPNMWGANTAAHAGGGWSQADDDEDTFDYDLAPWIAAGRVRWIAPGDAALRLRDGVDGCPYLGMDGPQRVQRVQDGEVW